MSVLEAAAAGSATSGVAGSADPGPAPLSAAVERALRAYLADLDGEPACDLYEQVFAEVEEPLLRVVMEEVGGNQCRAADVLGMSRGTLRKKLKKYGML